MNRGKAQRRLLPRRPAPALTLALRAAMRRDRRDCRDRRARGLRGVDRVGRADAERSAAPNVLTAPNARHSGTMPTSGSDNGRLSLDRAVTASASRVRAWRVLAAEIDARGQTVESSPHLDVLARTGRPVIPVFRISGRLPDWDESARTAPNSDYAELADR